MSQKRQSEVVESPRKERRVLTKTEYDTYNPTLNQFLGDQRIRRKDAPALNDQKDTVAFEWMSVDLYDGMMMKRVNESKVEVDFESVLLVPRDSFLWNYKRGIQRVLQCSQFPSIYIHSLSPTLVHLHRYFYITKHPLYEESDREDMVAYMTEKLQNSGKVKGKVLDIQLCKHKSIYFYQEHDQTYMKVIMQFPNDVTLAREVFRQGTRASEFKNYRKRKEEKLLGTGSQPRSQPQSYGNQDLFYHQIFEAKLPFVLRYMVDHDIVGCNWLQLNPGKYRLLSPSEKRTMCQYECDVIDSDVVSLPTKDDFSLIAPFRILSFDIECCAEEGGFPSPEKDAVITIANVVTEQGSTEPLFKSVFTLRSCASIPGVDVYCFEDEKDMLAAWSKYLVACDADIITGYNIQNFDIDYLRKRAATLKVKEFDLLGRVKGEFARCTTSTFSSAAYGTHENIDTNIAGRLIFDVMQFVRREYKLSSYTLNNVSSEFLGQTKEDVKYNQIKELFNGDDVTRQRIASYCVKDAWLPQQLLDKLNVIINQVEMARVTGVPINMLLSRGQQIKVLSMIHRKSLQLGYIIPTLDRSNQSEKYEGATVIEPKKGYYEEPIATLDFASLYPSIMIAHNICYSTLIPDSMEIDESRVERSPTGNRFLKKSEREGVLPIILRELLAARKVAKKDMAKETDPLKKAVQNGRQLALKVSANSVYGFTGATVGQLPCLAISRTVTSYGRTMIEMTQKKVMERYCIKNGYEHDAMIVYGDTDSVMVKFGVKTVEEAMKLGKEAAEYVSGFFPDPVRLEFEKVYFPYLLMNKKRYAGLFWTKPEKWDKLDAKGIETVRRDNCRLVRILVDTCLKKLLIDRSPEDAVEYVKSTLSALLQNQIDISLLVITKALGKKADDDGKGYKAKAAHVELAKRMAQRDPGSAPKVGDRVAYVIIEKDKGAKAYTKSEDPIYVLENNLQIDVNWYLEHQLRGPIERIFAVLKNHTLDELFKGEHMNVKKVVVVQNSGIGQFVKRKNTCMHCKRPLQKGAVCSNCKSFESAHYIETAMQVELQQRQFCELWTTCQRCQNSLHKSIICGNKDCPIYYQREKIRHELDVSTKKLERFSE